ncbi:MAG TPA: poly-gamma-glutamate biosynthesis protein PgsC [Polyangiaceae bacterium]|nr:poly-gamma-glutamate biosynthesis protein PgsC [Polyangiaceae bacterium]
MNELLPLSIGIGLAVNLLLVELFGLAAAGLIIPGYIALELTRPLSVALTLGGGLCTYLIVQTLSSFTIVYGRRRTVAMILVGYLVGMFLRWAVAGLEEPPNVEHAVIGYIIPGLIAIGFDRQGLLQATAALLTSSCIVRLILVLVAGAELGP